MQHGEFLRHDPAEAGPSTPVCAMPASSSTDTTSRTMSAILTVCGSGSLLPLPLLSSGTSRNRAASSSIAGPQPELSSRAPGSGSPTAAAAECHAVIGDPQPAVADLPCPRHPAFPSPPKSWTRTGNAIWGSLYGAPAGSCPAKAPNWPATMYISSGTADRYQ